jgi:hypothetical protein
MKNYLFVKITYFIVLFFYSANCIGQGVTNNWVMGYYSNLGYPWGGTNINFINGFPDTSYEYREMDFYVSNGVISDTSGNLLFYTNGIYVANASGDTMLNGSNLNPGPFADNYQDGMPLPQGNLVLPVPNNPGKYYLFHETDTYMPTLTKPLELFYTVIDMSMDGGLGGVVLKNQIVLQDTLEMGELSATKHANGRDWWILFHKVFSDMFYKLLVTPYGINIYTQNIGTIRNEYGGTSGFANDGSMFAHYNANTDLDIYDFDRCTGLLSNFIHVPINDSALYGHPVFSPNNKILYVPSTTYVYQFDLTAANIPASMQTIAVWDGFCYPWPPLATNFFMGQLAPDGKIYICALNGTSFLHVINKPDSLGLTCDLQQHSIFLPTYNFCTIPNFPNYFLGPIPGSSCDSLTSVQENGNNTIPIRINPNPAQNTFYLNYELPYGKTAVATLFNTIGEAVLSKTLYWYFGYLQIDCSSLSNGVYIVKVETKGYDGSAKLVIAR